MFVTKKRSSSPRRTRSDHTKRHKDQHEEKRKSRREDDRNDRHEHFKREYKGRRDRVWQEKKQEASLDGVPMDDPGKKDLSDKKPRKFKEEFEITDSYEVKKEISESDSGKIETPNIEETPVEIETSSKPLLGLASTYEETKYPCKKRHAVLMGFSGEGYKGMMLNPGVKTIEAELIKAMVKVDLIKPENGRDIKKTSFQRASRTDKGVSAARQVCSVNLHAADIPVQLQKLNAELPADIIIYDIIRTTKNFDSHKFASSRVYEYMCPSFAMAPTLGDTWSGYRIPKQHLETVREMLLNFKGTKNFFNYTSNVKQCDPSCFRYIRDISCSEPFEAEGMEWLKVTLHGDSFIYHQIRKIIGMTITMIRNVCPADHLEKSFMKERCDVPLAPGVGLILNEVKMDRYNQKFGENGTHTPLKFDPYEETVKQFKKDHIESVILKKEKTTNSMFNWLETLKNHKFYTGNVLPVVLAHAVAPKPESENLKPVKYSGNIVVTPKAKVCDPSVKKSEPVVESDVQHSETGINEEDLKEDNYSCVDMVIEEDDSKLKLDFSAYEPS